MAGFTKQKRDNIRNKYKGKCAYCGIKLTSMHVDHIIPKQRGFTHYEAQKYGFPKGTDRYENLNPSCPSCNTSKSTFSLDDWKEQLQLKVDRLRRDNTNFRLLEKFGLITTRKKEIVFYFEKIQLKNNGKGTTLF